MSHRVDATATAVYRSVEEGEPDWDDLADRVGASPFLRPGWVRAWWGAFGHGGLRVAVARRDGRPVGVLPFVRRRGVVVSPTNWHSHEYAFLAADADAVAVLTDALVAGRPHHVRLDLLREGTPELAAYRARAAALGYRSGAGELLRSPYVPLVGGWSAYEQGLGARKLRELRRRGRRLAEAGRVTFEVSDGAGDLDGLLDEGFRVEAAGWKGAAGTAIAAHPHTRRFYAGLAGWARERGWLRRAFLRLSGRAIAFDLALEHAGVHYLLKTGYDPTFRAYAPGALLRREMLARAFAGHLARYEFLGDTAPWKREWASREHVLLRLRSYAPSTLGRLQWSAHVRWAPAYRRARERARRLAPR
ncbi:MAG: GNAT family N-acetyltransferase [Actinobacteria bacterium]|nr:GNAT family N-acetyltransferase [Actinomycetota bacterium]